MFAYLKSLVDMGVFKEIFLNFLPVGHTHCDIDQLFSRISVFLRGKQCLSQHFCSLFIEVNGKANKEPLILLLL
jgi:hypothetical protein